MSTTTVGPVKAALKTLWENTFGTTVQVTYGSRSPGTTRGQWLTIGNVTGTGKSGPGLGPARQKAEDYEVTCRISKTVNGKVADQQVVTEAVLGLFATAEEALRALPSQNLGVSEVVLAVVEGDWELTESEASETGGPINTTYEFKVRVQARYRLP